MKASELRGKNAKDLQKDLQDLLREQFNLRMQRGSGQLSRPHLMRAARRNIARVKTAISEQQNNEGKKS